MFLAVGQNNGKIFLVRDANRVARSLQAGEPVNYYDMQLTPVTQDVVIGQDKNQNDIVETQTIDQILKVSNKLAIKSSTRSQVRTVESVELEADGKVVDSAEVEV